MSAEIIRFGARRRKAKSVGRTKKRSRLQRARKTRDHSAWFGAFGARLRATRLTFGISEAEAASTWLMSLRTYRKYEAGLPHRSNHRGLIAFVDKYGTTYDWLLTGGGPMRSSEFEIVKRHFIAQQTPKLTVVSIPPSP